MGEIKLDVEEIGHKIKNDLFNILDKELSKMSQEDREVIYNWKSKHMTTVINDELKLYCTTYLALTLINRLQEKISYLENLKKVMKSFKDIWEEL